MKILASQNVHGQNLTNKECTWTEHYYSVQTHGDCTNVKIVTIQNWFCIQCVLVYILMRISLRTIIRKNIP